MHRLTSDFDDLARITAHSTGQGMCDLYADLADKLIIRLVQEIPSGEIQEIFANVCGAPKHVFEDYGSKINKMALKI